MLLSEVYVLYPNYCIYLPQPGEYVFPTHTPPWGRGRGGGEETGGPRRPQGCGQSEGAVQGVQVTG